MFDEMYHYTPKPAKKSVQPKGFGPKTQPLNPPVKRIYDLGPSEYRKFLTSETFDENKTKEFLYDVIVAAKQKVNARVEAGKEKAKEACIDLGKAIVEDVKTQELTPLKMVFATSVIVAATCISINSINSHSEKVKEKKAHAAKQEELHKGVKPRLLLDIDNPIIKFRKDSMTPQEIEQYLQGYAYLRGNKWVTPFKGMGKFFYEACKEKNVDPSVALGMFDHETMLATSELSRRTDNPGNLRAMGEWEGPAQKAGVNGYFRDYHTRSKYFISFFDKFEKRHITQNAALAREYYKLPKEKKPLARGTISYASLLRYYCAIGMPVQVVENGVKKTEIQKLCRIKDLLNTYAPAADKNNPSRYAQLVISSMAAAEIVFNLPDLKDKLSPQEYNNYKYKLEHAVTFQKDKDFIKIMSQKNIRNEKQQTRIRNQI